jgi:uncharacterized protein (TIGR04222 family)
MTPFRQNPGNLDPYEVAYLRGGRNEVARVVIVSLVERRILELQQPDSGLLRSFVKGRCRRSVSCRRSRPRRREARAYRDPVAELSGAAAERYRGSWVATFAPVTGTDFVVIVQQR